ncbi:hypothetical protein KFV96_28950, partial [Klebsiella pneumoniae]|nr:hypothetical protein [Klebsiella pneumoniae]
MLEKKIENDYTTITEEDLKMINGFIVKIDNNIRVQYAIGYIDEKKFDDIKLEDCISLLGFKTNSEFKVR